jgi:mono/diheme cytochrome c family protein
MRRMKRIAAFGVASVLGLALLGCPPETEEVPPEEPPAAQQPEPETPTTEPPAGDLAPGTTPEQVAQGEELFRGNGQCHTCHGPDAQGTPLAPNLTSGPWLQLTDGSFDEIRNNIVTGVPEPVEAPAPMPPMGGAQLTDQQIDDLAAYVYSISRGKGS